MTGCADPRWLTLRELPLANPLIPRETVHNSLPTVVALMEQCGQLLDVFKHDTKHGSVDRRKRSDYEEIGLVVVKLALLAPKEAQEMLLDALQYAELCGRICVRRDIEQAMERDRIAAHARSHQPA